MDTERDFFVSYTAADRAWAEWLAWEINAAGYTTLLQAWDMPPGTAFVHAMDQAVQHTRHTVLVLSEAYLRSPMTEAEWRPGFLTDSSGIQRRLLPVRVEPCEGALAVRETHLGPDHPDTIKSRRLLTALTSKLKEAE